MQKENIIIKSIVPIHETKQRIGEPPQIITRGLNAIFDYKTITDSNISIECDRILTEEEIKDKIIEVLE